MKYPLIILASNLFWIINPYFCLATPTYRCLTLGVLLVHSSKYVFRTTLLGTLFNIYMTNFNTYIDNDTSKLELLNILLIISINILLCLSDTPFVIVYLELCIAQKSHLLKEFSEWIQMLPSFIIPFVILITFARPDNFDLSI